MPNDEERRSEHNRVTAGGTIRAKATIRGTAPRVAPEKVWDSEKPPGGKIPAKSK